MDFKRIITLFLAIVMCVNLLASAFPTVAYASGGEMQMEASDMSEANVSDDVIMEISGEAKDIGQALEEEKTAEDIGENASVADEEQKTEDDSEKETETETAAPVEETEKETLIDSGSEDIVVSEDTVKQEEATELQETEEEKVVRLKEMVEAFPEEAELWWMDEDELTVLYDTFSEICDMYESLDAELQEQVDMRKLEAAGAFFASYVDPVSLTNTGDIYSIPSEYGAGIIYQGRKSTAVYGPGWKDGRYATNHSKDKNVWIKYPESGSCYVNGEHVKADVLVYYWLTEGEAFVATSFGHDLVSIGSPAWCGYEPQDFTVELEYHFLRAGTDEELTVDGYLFAHDLDRGEGICGKTGAIGYYTSDNTTMRWKGQYVTGTVDDDRTDYSMSVGVAFHAEPSAPFRVSYHGCEYYSIELSSVGVDGKLLKGYGDLNVVKSITNPSSYAASLAGFTMTLTGTSAYGDAINLTAVTNASGVASFTRVPMGTYTVTENGTASYWDVPASGTVNVEPNQTSLYSVNNIYKTGNVELTKKIETAPEDAYNAAAEAEYHYNDKLVGFAYRISGTSDSGIPVLKYGVTDTQGKLIFKNLPVGTYEVQEVKASAVPADADCKEQATQELYQYVIPDSQKVAVTYNDTAHTGNTSKVSFENKLKKWSFSGKVEPDDSLLKEDEEALSAGISQGDATLAGAVYGLYDGDKLVAQATTDIDGKFDFEGVFVVGDLWYVQEIKASEGYLLDSTKYPVKACALELDEQTDGIFKAELKATTAGKNTVTEQVKKQALSFYKISGTDKQSSFEAVAGAKFSVYLVSELADGKYAALSDAELPQAIIDDFRNPTTLDFDAMRQQRPATVYADAGSEDVANGRLAKSVTYADGMAYQADGNHAYLVAELISDSRGVVTTPGLPYGRYVIVEATTPKDKIATRPFVVNIVGDDEDGEIRGDGQGQPLDDLVIAVDKPIMSLIRIKKQDANSNKTVLKPGAGYIIHDTNGAWFQYCSAEWTSEQKRAYKNKYGDLVVQSGQGEMVGTKDKPYTTRKITQAEATGNVYVDTPAALPAGTYTLEEVAAPEGYVLQGHEGVIAKDTSIIEGNHTFYETEESGMWGKVDGSVVKIVVSSQEASYDSNVDAFVVTAIQKNEPAIGKISIFAEGEKLVDAKQDGSTILDRLGEAVSSFFGYARGLIGLDVPDEDGLTEKELSEYKDYSFSYELQPIEGAQFEIRAAEDIYSPEGGANVVKLFSEGELVTTLTTNAGGQTWTGQEDWKGTKIAKGLPLGKYTVTQIKAGTGFALTADDVEPREVEIAYAGQEVPVIYRDSSYENPRQKVHVEIQKLDAEQNEPLAGAVFGLYAEEDIANYTGKTVIKAGTLIATGETTVGADGQVQKAVFTPDLPLGKYYIKELQAPMGYTTTQSKISLDASYKEDQREVIEFSENVKNDPVLLQVNVMDYYTEEELDGATLQLIDEDGNSFTTILSAHGDNEIIRGLEIGKTYTLQELVSPQGYHYNLYLKDDYVTKKPNAVELDKSYLDGQVSDKITFTIKDENKLQVVSVFNKPITGNVVVKKTGQVPTGTEQGTDTNGNTLVTPIYEVKGLPGAEYALIAKEDIVYPDGYTGTLFAKGADVLEQYDSLKDTVLKHYTVEVSTGELVDVSSYIGITPDVDATDKEMQEFYQNHKDEVQRSLADGSAVKYVLRTDANGKVRITGLPLGEYEVVEVKAPIGYYRDQNDCTQQISLVESEQSGRPEPMVSMEVDFENAKQEVQEPENPNQTPEPKTVIYHPDIKVTKNAEKFVYEPGETVQYHILITNTGDVDLKDIPVRDSMAGGVIETIDYLAVGESQEISYDYQVPEDAVAGSRIDNIVVVKGTPVVPEPGKDEDGQDILIDPSSYVEPSGTDAEKVLVKGGEIQILKTAQKRMYHPGETAVYEMVVVNPTEQPIQNIVVKDSLAGAFQVQEDSNISLNEDGTVTVKELVARAQVTLKYTYEIPADAKAGSLENVAWATGTVETPDGPKQVEDEDKEVIVVQKPEIQITKMADKEIYAPGETVIYDIVVKNTGNCALTNIEVTEQMLKDGAFVTAKPQAEDESNKDDSRVIIDSLAVGETVHLTYQYTIPEDAKAGEAIYNWVTVTGESVPVIDPMESENPDGSPNFLPTEPVHDADEEIVHVIRADYGMAVTKYSVDDGIRNPMAGAEFTVYAATDIKNILGEIVYEAGTEIETAISDKDGIARFQTDFPLGLYKVKETKAPKGHYSSTKELLFNLMEQEYNDNIQYLHFWSYVENAITEVSIKLVDDMTGNELAGATLTITDEEGKIVDAWITKVENGYTVKGLDVDKNYTIIETVPRDGYLVDFTGASMKSENATIEQPVEEKVRFKLADVVASVNENGKIDKTTVPARTEILLENPMVVGNVRINKDGEVLDSWTLTDKMLAFVKSVFNYRKAGLAGVGFEVKATEDIVHPDGVTGVLFHKGDIVAVNVQGIQSMAKAVTDELGTVSFEGMYLGKYELLETQTAEGYVCKTEPTAFSLAYVDGYTSPVSAVAGDINITNPRQKVKVSVIKTDVDTGENLRGAAIGLYTAEAVRNYAGKVIVQADTLLESVETDADGKAVFECDLPFGKYWVKELTAPDGYYRNDETQYFTFQYEGDDTECVEIYLEISDKKMPEPTNPGHHGSSSNAVPLSAPQTSDKAALELAALGAAGALAGLAAVKRKNKKKQKEEE